MVQAGKRSAPKAELDCGQRRFHLWKTQNLDAEALAVGLRGQIHRLRRTAVRSWLRGSPLKREFVQK